VKHLIAWLQLGTVFSITNFFLVFIVAVLGVLSAFSHRSFFKAVVVARHEHSTFDKDTDVFSSLEFTDVRNSVFGRSPEGSGADLF
jgi:hypothetical protein